MMHNSLWETKMLIAVQTIKDLLAEISKIENDTQTPTIEKISKTKNIRQEISKVSLQIDNIKREITILTTHNIN
jgi:hypothetical protein